MIQVNGVWQTVERTTYTPYGAANFWTTDWSTSSNTSANSNTILCTGQTLDTLIFLYYYRARFYDAALERFINRDPVGYNGGDENLYRYVTGSPAAHTDPTGNIEVCSYPTIKPCFSDDTVTIVTSSTTPEDAYCWQTQSGAGTVFTRIGETGSGGDWAIAGILESGGCCIKTLNISGHGFGCGIATGNGTGIYPGSPPSILERIANRLCEGATVNLHGCHTAENRSELQKMANLLHAKVCGCTGHSSWTLVLAAR